MAVWAMIALYLIPNMQKMQSFAHILSLLWEKVFHSHTPIYMDKQKLTLDLTMDSTV